ncbi:hypothetical protein Lser_V15G16914 [Lactuca serriola]
MNKFLIKQTKEKQTINIDVNVDNVTVNGTNSDDVNVNDANIDDISVDDRIFDETNVNDNNFDDANNFYKFDIFDPTNWETLDSNMLNILALPGPKRDLSIQKYPKDKYQRRFSALYYTRVLPNGEECDRDWLVYSMQLDKIFCVLL